MTQQEESRPKSPFKKIATRFLRAAFAVAPIVWIYARADAPALREALSSVSVPLLAAILAITTANMILQGVKWWVLIRRFAPELKWGKAVSVHLESMFYSIVIPSAAQDVVKSVMLSKTHDPSVVWAATWLSRLVGLFSLLAFSVTGFMLLDDGVLPAGSRASMLIAVAAIAILSALSFSKKLTRPVRAAAAKFISRKIMAQMEKLRDGIYAFKRARKTLALTFMISVIMQFTGIFNVSLIIYAISGQFYFVECLTFVPLVEIMVVALPLTPGGMGIREGLMALLFTQLGLDEERIALYVTISLAASMTRILGGIPPLSRLLNRRKPSAASETMAKNNSDSN